MPQADVRAALVEYFANPPLPGVQIVEKDLPFYFDGANWNVSAETGWAAVLAIHIDSTSETRITLPARTPDTQAWGNKKVAYTVSIIVQQQYLTPTYRPPGWDETDWTDALDTLLDSITDRIHRDPTAGSGGNPIFEFGQDDNDIQIEQEIPTFDEGRLYSWCRVQVNVTEIINA